MNKLIRFIKYYQSDVIFLGYILLTLLVLAGVIPWLALPFVGAVHLFVWMFSGIIEQWRKWQ